MRPVLCFASEIYTSLYLYLRSEIYSLPIFFFQVFNSQVSLAFTHNIFQHIVYLDGREFLPKVIACKSVAKIINQQG